MGFKHSSKCYRVIEGERFVGLQPRMLKTIERPLVAKLRNAGIKVHLSKHEIYVPEARLAEAAELADDRRAA